MKNDTSFLHKLVEFAHDLYVSGNLSQFFYLHPQDCAGVMIEAYHEPVKWDFLFGGLRSPKLTRLMGAEVIESIEIPEGCVGYGPVPKLEGRIKTNQEYSDDAAVRCDFWESLTSNPIVIERLVKDS